ncbi:MAG: hypothetical protein ACRCTG_14510 [Aestuariivirga sp.]
MSEKPRSAVAILMARDLLDGGARPEVEHECIIALITCRRWLIEIIDQHIDEARAVAQAWQARAAA